MCMGLYVCVCVGLRALCVCLCAPACVSGVYDGRGQPPQPQPSMPPAPFPRPPLPPPPQPRPPPRWAPPRSLPPPLLEGVHFAVLLPPPELLPPFPFWLLKSLINSGFSSSRLWIFFLVFAFASRACLLACFCFLLAVCFCLFTTFVAFLFFRRDGRTLFPLPPPRPPPASSARARFLLMRFA